MARKQSHDDSYENRDPREDEAPAVSGPAADQAARAPDDDTLEALEALGTEEPCALPSLDDLESRGFTPEQVRRLVVVSDRAADSTESRAAEAELRRLRFTRWLVEHGMLDEWSA